MQKRREGGKSIRASTKLKQSKGKAMHEVSNWLVSIDHSSVCCQSGGGERGGVGGLSPEIPFSSDVGAP